MEKKETDEGFAAASQASAMRVGGGVEVANGWEVVLRYSAKAFCAGSPSVLDPSAEWKARFHPGALASA